MASTWGHTKLPYLLQLLIPGILPAPPGVLITPSIAPAPGIPHAPGIVLSGALPAHVGTCIDNIASAGKSTDASIFAQAVVAVGKLQPT